MDFYRQTGVLIFGTRLKRLSDRFLSEITKVYKDLEIRFESGWFPFFYLLYRQESMTVTEIATKLQVTQSAVSQLVLLLKKKNLIHYIPDENDKRKRVVAFTEDGKQLVQELLPIWESIERCTKELFDEREYSHEMVEKGLNELEELMNGTSLASIILDDLKRKSESQLRVFPIADEYRSDFRRLLLDWLLKHEDSELESTELLNCPVRFAEKEGNGIYLAHLEGEIAGALIMYKREGEKKSTLMIRERWLEKGVDKELLNYVAE